MQNVPNIISTKDLDYLSDIFNWNFTASKKALQCSKNSKLEPVRNTLENVAIMHSNNCSKIVEILGGNYE